MNNEDKGLACLGTAVIVIVALVASVAVNGFVLERLWEWFVVPFGAPSITLVHALGLSMLLGAFGVTRKVKVDEKDVSWGKATITVLSPLVLLGLGWILYQFM